MPTFKLLKGGREVAQVRGFQVLIRDEADAYVKTLVAFYTRSKELMPTAFAASCSNMPVLPQSLALPPAFLLTA